MVAKHNIGLKFGGEKTCRIMDDESGGGFSFLFSKLCELSFNNEANKGWDVYRRPRYTDRRREALKLCLYETLFEELRAPWVGELRRTQNKLNQDENCSFGVFDKLSITAFKFRLARRFDDADQLEHLVCKWRNLDGRWKWINKNETTEINWEMYDFYAPTNVKPAERGRRSMGWGFDIFKKFSVKFPAHGQIITNQN